MTFWTKLKLIFGGFVSGLLLLLGLHVFRRGHHGGNKPTVHEKLEKEWEQIEKDHKEKVEKLKQDIKQKPLESKMEDMNEKATEPAPWSDVSIIIPNSFRATGSKSAGTNSS